MKKKAKEKPASDKDYFREATNWDIDREVATRNSARIAWAVAGFALLCTLGMTGAIALMMPLKKVEPYVVKVDNATGIVEVVDRVNASASDYSEAVTKYFMTRYVRGREGYSYPVVDQTYTEVVLLSGPQQARQYRAYMSPRNVQSPVNTLGEKGTLEVKIKSISFLKSTVANVRYRRIERYDGSLQSQTDWIATVTFDYVNLDATPQQREINPLGFQALDYRVDPEVITNSTNTPVDSTTPVEF